MLSLCQFLTCSLSICPQAQPGKVNIPSPTPHLSVSDTFIHTSILLSNILQIVIALLSFFAAPYALTHLFPCLIFILQPLNYIPTHTSILSVCLSAPLLTLGTGTNTLEGLQFLAQLQFAVVLNRTWLN